MNKVLKGAVILLIAIAMVFSTITVTADSIGEQISLTYETSIDTEKYIWDEINQEWVDADNENEALNVAICDYVTFKIIIHNTGDVRVNIYYVQDQMKDGLTFISADPEPDYVKHAPPYWDIHWDNLGYIIPGETIEITLIAHVEGPECNYDWNDGRVWGKDDYGNYVADKDYCWVHFKGCGIPILKPFLYFLENHPNMFPMLRLLLQKFGL